MKQVIKGKLYNTETAQYLGCDAGGDGFGRWCEELYLKRTGEFFLYGKGGPRTQYAVAIGDNSWSGGEKIIPLTFETARQWAEEHLDADEYGEIFGMPDEDAEPVTISAKLPADLIARARNKAQAQGTSLTAIIEAALNKYV